MSGDNERKFTFQYLDGRKFPSLESKENKELLMKWSMKGRICAQMFSFDQPFQSYQKDDFAKDFMKDPNVISNLRMISGDKWTVVGIAATSVTAEVVPCSVLSMTLFDRLTDKGVVRESGHISKCFDEFYGEFQISDELRKMLLIDDSDNYCLYSDSERDEFLFRIFFHLCLGGRFNQFEDEIQPYLDVTKQIYKDLISVQKNPDTKDLSIVSCVFKLIAKDGEEMFYPAKVDHENTFSYLVVDPIKRTAAVLYHNFGASEFE
ncbi:cilia- and flagella-associated protein 300-like [Saccostrea echinata]|uniref:cilia- and flagella-associated protein 300-like n=1 Tax=Saccostrea echinata TaxID=191078 RepID=UPI002A81DE17|nr:cilia- and flagella-associated protein 300-like [Saccostrea echinata]